ncbi:MAG: hypothetical protein FE045_02410 [Thermoplasmata archaeon]|nr:MAG: hypothetical protein FE045_02410 [Thermoplasmata archaeon]
MNELVKELYRKRLIKTWYRDNKKGWKLVSGIWSPFYIQLRNLPSYPALMKKIGSMLSKKISNKGNKLLGIAMAGIPIATAISLSSNIPMCYTRKIVSKEYGEHSLVEGEMEDGDRFIAVDDIVTKFDSKLKAINQLYEEAKRRKIKVECNYVAVVIDREQGGEEIARKHGIKLISIIKFKEAIEILKEEMNDMEYEIIKDYLNNPEKYQHGL